MFKYNLTRDTLNNYLNEMYRTKSVMKLKSSGDDDDSDTIGTFRTSSSRNRPTPKQFDKFIPWMCSQYGVTIPAVVIRLRQDDIVVARKISARSTRRMRRRTTQIDEVKPPLTSSSSGSGKLSSTIGDNVVPVKAYYNKKNQLAEISITKCSKSISDVIIRAICMCIPVNSALTRLTFRRGGLTYQSVYEISKTLPFSNITDICFDDSFIPQGNYYTVLEEMSHLKYLSLNRCRINDVICKKIAMNIDYGTPAATTLRVLELSSNEITDSGVQLLGSSLKRNRCLLHLNLSGNRITDVGFKTITDTLKEFPLSPDETYHLKFTKMKYQQEKLSIYEACLEELHEKNDEEESSPAHRKMAARRLRRKKQAQMNLKEECMKTQAESMATRIVGELKTPYNNETIVVRDDIYYCKGNLTLCSLNVAYNNLDLHSIHRILEVLVYQSEVQKEATETGLIRVSLDGNYLPTSCLELNEIDNYLKKVLDSKAPRTSSSVGLKKLLGEKRFTMI